MLSVKAHANVRNKCQQLPTLLGVVGQPCCVRLHGPKSLAGFKLYATSANKCQHCCGSMKTDATSQCLVLLANNVGSVCMGLYQFDFTTQAYTVYVLEVASGIDRFI